MIWAKSSCPEVPNFGKNFFAEYTRLNPQFGLHCIKMLSERYEKMF